MSWDRLDMVWHFPVDATLDKITFGQMWFDGRSQLEYHLILVTAYFKWSMVRHHDHYHKHLWDADQVIVNFTDVAQRPKDPKTQKLNDPKTRILNYPKTQRLTDPMTRRPKDSHTQRLKSWLGKRSSRPLSLASLRSWSHHCFPHWYCSIMRLQSIGGEAANDWQLLSFFFFFFAHHYLSTFFFAHFY